MRFFIAQGAKGIVNMFTLQIGRLLIALNDIAWYLTSNYSHGTMAQIGCNTPCLTCIRKAKQAASEMHVAQLEREECLRKERIRAAEEARIEEAEKKRADDEIVRKAKAYDLLSEKDFHFTINNYNNFHLTHIGDNYYNCPPVSAPENMKTVHDTALVMNEPFFATPNQTDIAEFLTKNPVLLGLCILMFIGILYFCILLLQLFWQILIWVLTFGYKGLSLLWRTVSSSLALDSPHNEETNTEDNEARSQKVS